jgi:hypothetical protein
LSLLGDVIPQLALPWYFEDTEDVNRVCCLLAVSDKYSSKEISKMKMNTVIHGHTKVLGSSIKGGVFFGYQKAFTLR